MRLSRLLIILPAVAFAQAPSESPTPPATETTPQPAPQSETQPEHAADVSDLSLESLLDTPVEVTKDARSTREARR